MKSPSEKEAELVYQAELLKRCRDGLAIFIHDLEDEGDRVYFGSTNHADDLRDIYRNLDDWDIERHLTHMEGRDLYADLRDLRDRNQELEGALSEAKRAVGDHSAPDDCYSTGLLTGDPHCDLVECPACSFIALHADLIAKRQSA